MPRGMWLKWDLGVGLGVDCIQGVVVTYIQIANWLLISRVHTVTTHNADYVLLCPRT